MRAKEEVNRDSDQSGDTVLYNSDELKSPDWKDDERPALKRTLMPLWVKINNEDVPVYEL